MKVEEIYAKTIEILGTGVNRRTEISIRNNKIEVITDEGVTDFCNNIVSSSMFIVEILSIFLIFKNVVGFFNVFIFASFSLSSNM